MPRSALKFLLLCLFFGLIFFRFSQTSFAEVTPYKSASIVTTDTIIGSVITPFVNLGNCSVTDGLTCDRPSAAFTGNLYFRDFGDFGIPAGSIITAIRIRVTGKGNVPVLGLYTGLSRIGSPSLFYENCQSPSDAWTMYALNSSSITVYNATTPITNGILATCLSLSNIRSHSFIFRVNYSYGIPWSANIDNFEIGFEYSVANPTPTPSPTPSPSLTPTPPPPFLDLPWDYEEGGLSFNEAALNINSFFDHTYPLLSAPTLVEDNISLNQVTTYENENSTTKSYSKHDGYDYGSRAQANFGDPVLAAATGTATFVNSCGACGNAIHIDHGNGYQTRYYHLQEDGLKVSTPGAEVSVDIGDTIGKVGDTGNCYSIDANGNRIYNTPSCGHVHFMVVEDKNSDGDFDDNIPDGLVDPFGWQSTESDPWENYSFFYNGLDRTGNKSYYLWNENIDGLSASLSANGGVFTSGRNSVNFPAGATLQNLLLEIISSPMQKLSDLISSIGSTVQIFAKDYLGNPVTSFNAPFIVGIDFAGNDLSRFLIDTISIYSSTDGVTWQKEPTTVDLLNKKATTEVNHLTQFALMAERADIKAATTTAQLLGEEGDQGHFRSDVSVVLNAVDNEGGLGVDYILYRKDGGNWQEYVTPIQFSDEGEYSIEFHSVDNDENIEEPKSVTFSIDKTLPEAEIFYSLSTKDIQFEGKDSSGSASVTTENIGRDKKIVVTDQAGNTLEIIGKDKEKGRSAKITIESLQYNQGPLINIDPTKLLVNYNLKNKTSILKQLEQKFEVKGELKIKLIYSSKTRKTKVITKVKGQEKVKEELPGMRLLKLSTENGSLKYSY